MTIFQRVSHPLFEVRGVFFMSKAELEEAIALPGAAPLARVFEGAIAEFEAKEEKEKELVARARVVKRETVEKEFVPKKERSRFDGWTTPMLVELVRFLNQ